MNAVPKPIQSVARKLIPLVIHDGKTCATAAAARRGKGKQRQDAMSATDLWVRRRCQAAGLLQRLLLGC
jgi:hypothetical protein